MLQGIKDSQTVGKAVVAVEIQEDPNKSFKQLPNERAVATRYWPQDQCFVVCKIPKGCGHTR